MGIQMLTILLIVLFVTFGSLIVYKFSNDDSIYIMSILLELLFLGTIYLFFAIIFPISYILFYRKIDTRIKYMFIILIVTLSIYILGFVNYGASLFVAVVFSGIFLYLSTQSNSIIDRIVMGTVSIAIISYVLVNTSILYSLIIISITTIVLSLYLLSEKKPTSFKNI